MNKFQKIAVGSGVAATIATGALLAAPAAQAQGGGGVRATGHCSQHSTWKLTAKHDDGRIEVQFEVDSNVVGQRWAVKLSDNGTQVAKGAATTVAPSGSFEFRRLIANQPGSDTIRAIATQAGTGETCTGQVVLG